jgi:hypothetical protein
MEEQKGVPVTTRLTFDTADKMYLQKGTPIRLSDWGGFWFKGNHGILVLTKEGEFFDTPQDEYKISDFWEPVEMTQELAIKFITALRVNIDALYVTSASFLDPSRELSSARTALQLSFMWMGYLLKDIGSESPYKESYNTASPVIEKHADKAADRSSLINELAALDKTAQVKLCRKKVMLYLESLEWIVSYALGAKVPVKPKVPMVHTPSVILQHLLDTDLWFGQCLNNIRVKQELENK